MYQNTLNSLSIVILGTNEFELPKPYSGPFKLYELLTMFLTSLHQNILL